MASTQDKQNNMQTKLVAKFHEHFMVGDKVLLSTSTLPKYAVSVLPCGTTKLLSRFIGSFIVVEEVGDLNYSFSLPPYITPLPVFTWVV